VNTDRVDALVEQLAKRRVDMARRPKASGDWYRIENADGDRAELYIYGVIGSDWDPDDVTAGSFTRDLRNIKAPNIDLHINSPGGLVFDGVAIYSALLNHPATVDVSVDGIAASAASFVAMAGDTITVEKPAKMMIHNAHGLVIGNADDMREMADLLADLDGTIATIYSDRAGGPVEKWREAMRAETWYSASEAVEAGLADRVANDKASAPDNRRSQMIRARARLHLERV
jgi:ATP-dependent protease ClpP protease subunit